MSYAVGDTVRLFLDTTQPGPPPVRADADEITLTITNPDDTTVTAVFPGPAGPGQQLITRTGAGAYIFDATAAGVGITRYHWNAVGTDPTPWTVVKNDQFNTDDWAIRLLSLKDAKNALKYPASDNGDDDDELNDMIDSITSSLEQHCGPIIPRNVSFAMPALRKLDGRLCFTPPIWPLISITALDGDAAAVASWVIDNNMGVVWLPAGTTWTIGAILDVRAGRQPFPPCLRDGGKELLKYRWRGGRQRSTMNPGSIRTPDDFDARPATGGGVSIEPMPMSVLEIIGDEVYVGVA